MCPIIVHESYDFGPCGAKGLLALEEVKSQGDITWAGLALGSVGL